MRYIIIFAVFLIFGFMLGLFYQRSYDSFCKADNIEVYENFVRLYCEQNYLDIFISEYQIYSINVGLKKIRTLRPLTHDLFVEFIKRINMYPTEVIIYKLENNIYYSYLCFRNFCIDSRPSDAIAIAVRLNVPIYINKKLLEKKIRIGDNIVNFLDRVI